MAITNNKCHSDADHRGTPAGDGMMVCSLCGQEYPGTSAYCEEVGGHVKSSRTEGGQTQCARCGYWFNDSEFGH